MKGFIKTSLFAVIMALPMAASAQTSTTPQTDTPKPGAMMMNCPMMANMGGMQNDLKAMMSEVESMMKDTKDAAEKERLQKMQGRISAMMASMQKMGGTMMGMMSRQPQGSASGPPATPAPTAPPSDVSPEDHKAHHPAQ